MKLNFTFRLTGVGWAECHIADEISACTVSASYLSDALRYLVLAATAVLSGFRSATFSFELEPGEIRWLVSSPRINEIEITIVQFRDLYADQLVAEGTTLFKTKCRPRVFAEAVNHAASLILREVGEDGYAKQWNMAPFPSLQLRELARLLAINTDIVV